MTRIPALSKHYLRGTSDDIALHPIDWYEQRSIAAHLPKRCAAGATAPPLQPASNGLCTWVGSGVDDGKMSAHVRSRRQVESLLGRSGVPVVVLRAAVVIGRGGNPWEIIRQVVANLPMMLTPRWINTRIQPIALPDVVRYLVGVLDAPLTGSQVVEIGAS